jgi:hypothetical protein
MITSEKGSDIFNATEKTHVDNGIQRYEYHFYKPQSGSDLNAINAIVINIERKDLITHPSKSCLQVEGRLIKADGIVNDADAKVTLVNNGLMYLFSSIKLQLSDKTIESLNNPGQATTMLGLLK